ncbi:MAG: restriction endonuclease subunit S [Sphingomonas sp.]
MSSEGVEAVMGDGGQAGGLVPKLRFPEFQEAREWQQHQLSEIASQFGGGTPDTNVPEFWDGDILWITPAEMGKTFLPYVSSTRRTITSKALQQSAACTLPSNSIILSTRAPIGLLAINTVPMAFNQGCRGLVPKRENDSYFLYASLARQSVALNDLGSGSTFKELSAAALAKFIVPLPSPDEQQKIADCLSSLDTLIAAEGDRLAALGDHRTGLMQGLFPAPGQTTPRLRFPEFRDAGEWRETTIGEVGSFYYGKSAPKWSLEEDAPTPCVRYGELYTKFGPLITEIFSRTNIAPENLRFSKGGEILVPRVGEKPDDFGRNCSLLTLRGIAIGEMISVFETDQNALFYTFYFRHLHREFAKVVEGQNVKNLYYTELEPLKIYRPSMPEQARIAQCLLSLEQLAEASKIKLADLRRHKSGLMQQLFPSPAEASA